MTAGKLVPRRMYGSGSNLGSRQTPLPALLYAVVSRIGKRSAGNVIAVLRQRYQEDLAAAINELRTRD